MYSLLPNNPYNHPVPLSRPRCGPSKLLGTIPDHCHQNTNRTTDRIDRIDTLQDTVLQVVVVVVS